MGKLLSCCDKVGGLVHKCQTAFLTLLCVAITAINIAQIAGRYVFFYSLPWSEPLSVLLFLMIVFLGQNLVTRKDGEIRIEAFLHKRLQLIVSDLVCLVTVGALLVSSFYLIRHAARFPQIIPSLDLPYYYVFWMMPIGFFLIFLSRACVLLKRLAGLDASARDAKEEALP